MAVRNYTVRRVDFTRRAVVVETDAPAPLVEAHPPRLDLFGTSSVGELDVRATDRGALYTARLPEASAPDWPQAYPRLGQTYAVLPAWSFVAGLRDGESATIALAADAGDLVFPAIDRALDGQELAPVCLLAGMAHAQRNLAGCSISAFAAPSLDATDLAGDLEGALQALVAALGPPTFTALTASLEEQSPPLAREKGYAHRIGGQLVARFVVRVYPAASPADRADLLDLFVHELTHMMVEADSGPGSWLTEGLTTYLARRVLQVSGLVGDGEWRMWLERARLDLQANPHLDQLSLRESEAAFGPAAVANLVYAKGFLVGNLLDASLGGRLLDVARELAAVGRRRDGRFTREEFLAALPESVRPRLEAWESERGDLGLRDPVTVGDR